LIAIGTGKPVSGSMPFILLNQFKLTDFYFTYPFFIRKIVAGSVLVGKRITRLWRNHGLPLLKIISTNYYFEKRYWIKERVDLVNEFAYSSVDLILANDISSLPIACELSKGKIPIFFDAHEYHPRELENNVEWLKNEQAYVTYLCQKYIPLCAAMSTVCEGIAKEYERNFGVKSVVITNATDFKDLKPVETKGNLIRMIHHGAAIAERHIDLMISMMDLLDERFSLDLMLIPTQPEYLEEIKEMIKDKSNIRLLPPVATEEISSFTNGYDIGLFLLPPVNFNYEYALPNKLFEFIQARLAIAIGPSPEMARFVKTYDLGVIADDFTPEALAKKIQALDKPAIAHFKAQAHKHALELSSERNRQKIKEVVEALLSGKK
jgi:hypothetical protein